MTKYMGVTIGGGSGGGAGFPVSGLEPDLVTELYTSIDGANGLIDTNNSTSLYSPDEDSYGAGIVQTNRLYDSATAIASLKVNEITSTPELVEPNDCIKELDKKVNREVMCIR